MEKKVKKSKNFKGILVFFGILLIIVAIGQSIAIICLNDKLKQIKNEQAEIERIVSE